MGRDRPVHLPTEDRPAGLPRRIRPETVRGPVGNRDRPADSWVSSRRLDIPACDSYNSGVLVTDEDLAGGRREMVRAKLHLGLALSVFAVLLFGLGCKRNHPPSIPDVAGRRAYRPGDTAVLSATSTDLDDDSLSYLFAWVDTNSTDWSADYPSGEAATGSHAYAEPDSYFVRVRARDARGARSAWSAAETVRVGFFPPETPARPTGPDSGVTGDTYRCSTHSASPYEEPVLIEYNWGGQPGGWCPPVAGESACVGSHVFYLPGTHYIKARAGDTSGLVSAWSDSLAVFVVCRDTTPPAVDIVSPGNGDTVRRGVILVKAVATDDQTVTRVEFTIDGTLAGTDSTASPGDTFSHAWADTAAQIPNQSFELVATAYDAGGNQASATIYITVMSDLKWYWRDIYGCGMATSAIVANDGVEEVVMSHCYDDYNFYSIRTSDGTTKCTTRTRYPGYDFTGHPGLANGHIIVGSDEGELYALTLNGLQTAWQWPNKPSEESLTGIEWGAPAFNGNYIYIGHDDDSLFKFRDDGSQGVRVAAYGPRAEVVDAPVVDADGSVYFGTDSGYLIKIDANLTAPIWRTRLLRVGEVYGPVIGSDGTVYCGTDSSGLYAVASDGAIRWGATLDGIGARPAVGRSALFVGTEMGLAYSISPATGAINWQKSLALAGGFYTTPIVAANGYVYFQDDEDVLYCVNQADGTLIWSCDCEGYLPSPGKHRSSRRQTKPQLTYYDPNPSITADGGVIVVGYDALFCVNGHREGPLDPLAAWPKWQKNLANTGR